MILYLAATRDYALEFRGVLDANIFLIASDAAYGDYKDHTSSEGYLVKLFGGVIN